MANRIITFSGNKTVLNASLEVYSDVDILSKPVVIQYKNIIDSTEFVVPLSGEIGKDRQEEANLAYILDDPERGDAEKRRLYLQSGYTGNVDNALYNEMQRNKARYKIHKNINVDAIKRSIHNIFTWTPGERILNPEFGSKLRQYLYEGLTDYNREQITAEIRHCILQWEPRVLVELVVDMTSVYAKEDNTVVIDIIYTIPSLSYDQYNYTYVYLKTSD